MKHFVERTCTVIHERGKKPDQSTESPLPDEPESRPLESFRDEPAYVLLGSPGSGKTDAFKHEARHEAVEPITARDFRTLDPDPSWQDQTLYIDGLDETRAGSADGRTPFDEIRGRLQALGRPRFRLSCREADWFGANDRDRLKAVAPNSDVLVLRLDPLSDQGVLDILAKNLGVKGAPGFVAAARQRGVDGLLRNPLNLRMLAAAVADNPWPRTRTETFDMACRKLVSEENPEHQIARSGSADTTALLDAAGHLCAVLLLAGKAGVALPGNASDPDHPRLEDVPRLDQQLLQRVVGTNLFRSPSEGRLAPAHRQVAEFLAASHMAARIAKGFPARRVLSLMIGFDGRVVSEFRGLTAWLATMSQPARAEIFKRDPLGVVLYGEVQRFDCPEKRLLFQALKREIEQNPWLVSYTSKDSPLRSVVGHDLEDDMRRALTNPARSEAHQTFVLLIAEAIRDAASFPALADPLMAIVRDDSWRPTIRCAALEAYIRARQDDPRIWVRLRRLLDDIYTGVVVTQDDDLLGTLLTELYPDDLPVADLVGYLREPARRNLWTRYLRFWTDRLIDKSTIGQMVHLLDLLMVPIERVRSESAKSSRRLRLVVRPPILLLRHLLERSPQSVSREQIVYWLDFAAWLGRELRFTLRDVVSDAQFFGGWLSNRPDIQKAIIEQGVTDCREEAHFDLCMWSVKERLFGATPPEDYGTWCAKQSLGETNDAISQWYVGEAASYVHGQRAARGSQRSAISKILRDHDPLAQLFKRRLTEQNEQVGVQEPPVRAGQDDRTRQDGRFDDLRDYVKANVPALHTNRCPPRLLHHLAVAYCNGFSDVYGETPEERLRYLLGPDDDLFRAALAGLSGAIHHTDLPTQDEILRLDAERMIHSLAHPVLVALEESHRTRNSRGMPLSEEETRVALTMYFTVLRFSYLENSGRTRRWLLNLASKDPDIVCDVWALCAGRKWRMGRRFVTDVCFLAYSPQYASVAQMACLRLLESFPVKCLTKQLPALRCLLQAACLYADQNRLLALIEAKMGRQSMNSSQMVYWLAAGLFIRPESYGDQLESYVAKGARRVQRLAEMTVDSHAVPQSLVDTWSATVLARLIRLITPYSVPYPETDRAFVSTLAMQATSRLDHFINLLANDSSPAATTALESLAADALLTKWQSRLLDALHRQKSVCRETLYAHPRLEQVSQVLDNGPPANAADLWALTIDLLGRFSERIRDGVTSDWRQYWNVDKYNRPEQPKPENACRDALLSDLEQALAPLGVEGTKEGPYADDKQSDIRASIPGSNVPIEIKRSCHRELWSAMHTQLIAKYTRDPGTDGYGIYLVFWFGEAERCRPTPRSGPKPKSALELEQALLETLTDAERRKISVCVIDVSKPDG